MERIATQEANIGNTETFQINTLDFIIHSHLYTNLVFTSINAKNCGESQQLPHQLHPQLVRLSFRHVLNHKGRGAWLPLQKLETAWACSSEHVWVSTELNWDSIVFQAKSARRKSPIAV